MTYASPSNFLTIAQVCYSFWVLSALSILNKVPWIDCDNLTAFILSAQVRFIHSNLTRSTHLVKGYRKGRDRGSSRKRGRRLPYSVRCSRYASLFAVLCINLWKFNRPLHSGVSRFRRYRPRLLYACKNHRRHGSPERVERFGTAHSAHSLGLIANVYLL